MNKYLSMVYLYNRAGSGKILLIASAIPLCFLVIFLVRIGNPAEASSYMLMERAFGGIWGVLVVIAAYLLGYSAVVNAINGKKALKASHSTTGYTIRRMCISPISAYFIMFFYCLAMILIFWGLAIASLYFIGKAGLIMTGAESVQTKIALGLLRTPIGAALIPIANPIIIAFDIVAVLALAGECARSCYLGWHNGSPSAGVLLIAVLMFIAWFFDLSTGFTLLVIIIMTLVVIFSFGDVISREKRPKGDPFRVNKYSGIIDLDSDDFDEDVFLQVNNAAATYETWSPEDSILNQYGRIGSKGRKKGLRRISLWDRRRRYMPIGSNLEKANFFFGLCICAGIGEHLLFFAKYIMQMRLIERSIKGVTIDPGAIMPYFWEMEHHTFYGYFAAILLVILVQSFWNYSYYNKETKSVYVMKRLPDRKEYSRTIWVAPVMEAVIIALIMTGNILVDLGIYAFFTPDIALHSDYLSHLLPF